jgi:phosphoglycerate dehydrogenase-like enzyme
MKDTAVLINAGRGNLIDEKALCRALAEQQLAGAVLDVFRQEPLPPDSPLWDTPELKITGHIAAVSQPRDIVRLFAENYRLFNAGNELRYLVDFARGY